MKTKKLNYNLQIWTGEYRPLICLKIKDDNFQKKKISKDFLEKLNKIAREIN